VLRIIPEMGIAGDAKATIVSRIIGSIDLFYYIKRSPILALRQKTTNFVAVTLTIRGSGAEQKEMGVFQR